MNESNKDMKKETNTHMENYFGSNNSEIADDAIDNIIILNDEAGNDAEFEFLDLIEYEGDEYVILLPVEDDDEASEVVILRLEAIDNSDEESYLSVDDDDKLQAIFEIFKSKFRDQFNFVD